MNLHDEQPVRGRTVRDSTGRRLGRMLAVDYAATGTSEAWYLLRLTGWPRQLRAVPAASVRRGRRRSLQMALTRATVLRSPQLSHHSRRHGVSCGELQSFYAPLCALAGAA